MSHSASAGNNAEVFERTVAVPVSTEELFAWHERPGAFQRLNPPWENVEVVSQTGGIRDGGRAEVAVRIGPFRKEWVALHQGYQPPHQFQDVQLPGGPFQRFEHTHRIRPNEAAGSELVDHIEYVLPLGNIGRWLGGRFVRRKLDRAFRYRHDVTAGDLQLLASYRDKSAMKVLVTGATGLVGKSLSPLLTTQVHEVFRLVRRRSDQANDIPWDPADGTIDAARLEGIDAVVHLAGENIAGARWTPEVKQRLRDSRVGPTRVLCETLAKLQRKPKVLVCASAIGYYGDRGLSPLTEESGPGTGFLPELSEAWEAACQPARDAGIRVVNLRIGVVLSPLGGALQKMLLPFQLGLGGVIGSGRQYWSWIALDDLVGAIYHCLQHDELAGPVNATAPGPCTNYEFTKTLGGVLHRPTILPVPAFAAKLALGEMANDLLLASARVMPVRLEQTGYQFRYPALDGALRHVLGRQTREVGSR